MDQFSYFAGAMRVEFRRGAIDALPSLLEEYEASRALVLTTASQKHTGEKTLEGIGARGAGLFPGAVMHTPIETTELALKCCSDICADCLVSIGGGSTTGLGKALALRSGLPHIVVATSYAGSEVTPILGQTEEGLKTTINDPKILPTAVIYDPDLTDGLPLSMSIVSGLNAIAHAAEALYARDRNPISNLLAVEGLTAMKDGLEAISKSTGDKKGRERALYGAWLCGAVLGQVGMALHHKICHTLGGSFDMPHAETHAVMLAHTVGYNAVAVPELLAPLAEAFGSETGAGIFAFAKKVGAPTSLKELGLREADLDRAAEIAASKPYWNPRPVTRDGLRALLQDAFDGAQPREIKQ